MLDPPVTAALWAGVGQHDTNRLALPIADDPETRKEITENLIDHVKFFIRGLDSSGLDEMESLYNKNKKIEVFDKIFEYDHTLYRKFLTKKEFNTILNKAMELVRKKKQAQRRTLESRTAFH